MVGTLIGEGAAFVTAFLIGKYHLIHLPADMFMVSAVPVQLNPWNFILVAAATIALCLRRQFTRHCKLQGSRRSR